MPSSGYGIGQGIALGANAFVTNFFAARNMEFQRKQQQNQVAISALLSQLNDENTPLNKHGEIVDEIQRLANGGKPVKDDERLSKHLGLTPDSPLMNQQVDTGEVKKQTIGGGNVAPDTSITNPTDVSQLNQSMGSAPEMTANLPVMKKRGEMTPFDYKLALQKFGQKDEEERQIRLAKVQAGLRNPKYVLSDNGKDSSGTPYQVWINPENPRDRLIINLQTNKESNTLPQGFVSQAESIASTKANTIPPTIRNLQHSFMIEGQDEQTALNSAYTAYANGFQANAEGKRVQTVKAKQDAGELPPSPKMQSEEDTKKETEVNNILQRHRNAYADYSEVSSLLPAIQQQVTAAKQQKDEAQKAYNDFIKSSDYDAEDKDQLAEANRLKSEVTNADRYYNAQQDKYDTLVAKGTRAKNEMKSIANEAKSSRYSSEFNVTQGNLWQGQRDVWMIERNKFGTNNNQNQNESVNPISAIVTRPEVRAKIDNYRKANPKVQMTDEEWYQWLVDNKKIIPPK